MEQFITLVEKTGFFVLNLPQWGNAQGLSGRTGRRLHPGDCPQRKPHMLSDDQCTDGVVAAGDTKAVKAIIEGKLGVGVSR